MPDKYSCMFIENGLLNRLIGDLFSYSRPNIICNLLRILRYLASHQDCKAYILKYNGLEKTMMFQEYLSDDIKLEAMRLGGSLM